MAYFPVKQILFKKLLKRYSQIDMLQIVCSGISQLSPGLISGTWNSKGQTEFLFSYSIYSEQGSTFQLQINNIPVYILVRQQCLFGLVTKAGHYIQGALSVSNSVKRMSGLQRCVCFIAPSWFPHRAELRFRKPGK